MLQFCCGSLYSWSVFNKPIDQWIYGTSNANIAPITFYIAIGFYGCAAGLGGPWLEQSGPRRACLLGASLVLFGNLLTALALHLRLMWLVFIGYGCFAAAGFGICYISPVSALQKWFPDMRGLGAGFATCGFGAGSIVISKIQIPLMDGVGLPLTFVTLGLIFIVLMTTSALVLRTPPPDYAPVATTPATTESDKSPVPDTLGVCVLDSVEVSSGDCDKDKDPDLLDALTSTEFRIMFLMFVGDIIFGLVLASRLANIIIDVFGKTAEQASTVVSVNGAVNFAGRLLFSISSDYVGRKNCFILMLTTQVVILGCFSTMTNVKAFLPFWISIAIISVTYGAAFGVIPAFLSDKFGSTNIGPCHGIFIAGWSACGVIGGLVFTLIFNAYISSGYSPTDAIVYNANAWWLFGIACIGWVAIHFVKPTHQDLQFNASFKRLICCGKSS